VANRKFRLILLAKISIDTLPPVPIVPALISEPRQRGRADVMNKVVLLAEDNSDDVYFAQQAMRSLGVSIDLRSVPDGDSVIAWLLGQGIYINPQSFPAPDVVVLDSNLVGFSFLETLRWIREHSEFDHIPVVIHSSSNLASDIETARQAGANEYIVKDRHCVRLAHYLKILLNEPVAARP
jgi:CheY-like chemotaxis protein